MISEVTQTAESIEVYMNLVVLIDGKWDAKSKSYAIEYNLETVNLETFEMSFPSATEEEKAQLEEALEMMTEFYKTEGLKLLTSELPKGRQQYLDLKVDETQFSYLTENGDESWKKI